jgi:hypothetical protein
MNANSNLLIKAIATQVAERVNYDQAFRNGKAIAVKMAPRSGCQRTAHPNAELNANCSSELHTMNYAKGHLIARDRIGYSFRALVDRTIREQRREERRLAEQRATKHQFQARNSCILDGRNYRIARRLLLFAKTQFLTGKHARVS